MKFKLANKPVCGMNLLLVFFPERLHCRVNFELVNHSTADIFRSRDVRLGKYLIFCSEYYSDPVRRVLDRENYSGSIPIIILFINILSDIDSVVLEVACSE